MKKNSELFQRRNQQISREYAELDKQGDKHNTIILKLSEKFFLQPRTIYAVVSGEYEKRKQPIKHE